MKISAAVERTILIAEVVTRIMAVLTMMGINTIKMNATAMVMSLNFIVTVKACEETVATKRCILAVTKPEEVTQSIIAVMNLLLLVVLKTVIAAVAQSLWTLVATKKFIRLAVTKPEVTQSIIAAMDLLLLKTVIAVAHNLWTPAAKILDSNFLILPVTTG